MLDRNGRDDWIRTSGLTHPKGARYQAAPRPVKTFQYEPKEGSVKVALLPRQPDQRRFSRDDFS